MNFDDEEGQRYDPNPMA